jgi:hypothetical protein
MAGEGKAGQNPYVGIAAVVGGITVGMMALILLWAEGSEWIIVPVVLCMTLFGIMLGYYASKDKN